MRASSLTPILIIIICSSLVTAEEAFAVLTFLFMAEVEGADATHGPLSVPVHLQNTDKLNEKCEKPPHNPNYTKPVPTENLSRFRMECIENYVRKAGTSNLFKCINKSWVNEPNLACIRDPKLPPETTTVPKSTTQTHPPDSTTVLSYSSTSVETPYVTAEPERSTPATSTATTRTSKQTTLRTTTVEGTTRANMTTLLLTTNTQYSTSGSLPFSRSSTTPTTTTTTTSSTSTTTNSSTALGNVSTASPIFTEKQGIAVGIVLLLISAAAVTAAFLLWRRRSRRQIEVLYIAEMVQQKPFSDQSLLEPLNRTSSSVSNAMQSLIAPTAGHAE